MMSSLLGVADVGGMTFQDLFPKNMWDPGILIIVGSLLAVTLAVFIWAAFIRKPGSRPRSHHHSHSHQRAPAPPPNKSEEPHQSGWFFFRKRHRRRRRERPRNPTLAEAGGLPPIRTADQPRSPI